MSHQWHLLNVSWLFASLSAISVLGSFMCSFALGGYFPDIHSTPEFRANLEDALERQSITFDANEGEIHHHYLISYGPGYLQEHAMRIFDAQRYREAHPDEPQTATAASTETPVRFLQDPQGKSYVDTFKQFLHHKVFYEENTQTNDSSKTYTVRIRIPGRTDQENPLVFSFALVDFSDLPPLEAPWVTAAGDIQIKSQLRIKQLLKNFIYGEHQSSTNIKEAKERLRTLTDSIHHIEKGIKPNTDLDFVHFNQQMEQRVAAGQAEAVQELIQSHPDRELILLNALLERLSMNSYRLGIEARTQLQQNFSASVNRETLFEILRSLNPHAEADIAYFEKIIPAHSIFDLSSLTTTMHLVELNKERADLAELIKELICPREILSKFFYPNIVAYIQKQDETIPETLIARILEKMGLFTISNLQTLLGN